MNFEINKPLTAEEEEEANRLAEIAKRAEEKALLKLQQANKHESVLSSNTNGHANFGPSSSSSATDTHQSQTVQAAKFLTKQEREKLALERLELKRKEHEQKEKEMQDAHNRFITGNKSKPEFFHVSQTAIIIIVSICLSLVHMLSATIAKII